MSFSLEMIAALAVPAILVGSVGHRVAAASRDARLRRLQQALRRQEHASQQLGLRSGELEARIGAIEKRCERLRRTLVEIPEVAQQLAGTRRAREIAQNALDFVQKVFQPRYAAFYRENRGRLVAVAVHGECAIAPGHRVALGDGAVGACAQRQLCLAPEDLRAEARAQAASGEQEFSLCMPVVSEGRVLGVILVGPCEQALPQRDELARTIALIASVAITSAEVLRDQSRLAETDGLTGLRNRTRLLARAKALLGRGTRLRSVAFFLFDVDHFKHFNDSNGHLAGDELLKALSLLLRENTREEELVGRYGGEEFLVVMPGADREQALRAAERIRALIASTRFPHAEKQPAGCVSVSGGLSVWPIDGDDLETLLKRADEALYAAKAAGRNRVCAYATPELGHDGEPERVAAAVSSALLADELEHAFAASDAGRDPAARAPERGSA